MFKADISSYMPKSEIAIANNKTAFVLGNGPSLRGVDMKDLSQYTTVGLNAAYRYWREIDWRPTYYACLDEVVGISHKDEIAALIKEGRIEKFLLRGNLIAALGQTANTPKVINFDATVSRISILSPPTITTGSHAALWLSSLGFDDIVLLGIDGRYVEFVDGTQRTTGTKLEIVNKITHNPNYFFEGYQEVGDRYNIPNPRPGLHIEAWNAAATELRQANVTIYNANYRSEVTVFPYIELEQFLNTGSTIKPARSDIRARPRPSSQQNTAAQPNRIGKFIAFTKAQSIWLGLSSLPLVFVSLSALFLHNIPDIQFVISILLAGVIALLSIILLYVRYATTKHLSRLEILTNSLSERLADIERLDKSKL